jgi:hypothetical protein
MTPDQLAEAQRLSRELFGKIEANIKTESYERVEEGFAAPKIDPNTGLPIGN